MADHEYDPDQPEDSKKKSQYLSIKQFAIILVVIGIVVVLCIPSYLEAIKTREKVFCSQNMKAIGEAMLLYSSNNNDLMPPTHNMESDGSPALIDGLPVTWASQIQPLMSERQNFVCPSSSASERVSQIAMKEGEKTLESSYGMYRGLSAVPRAMIPNPSEVVAVAETSNMGALGSSDPTPFDSTKPDGFLIGWDTGNLMFSKDTVAVTRLSFFGQNGRHKSKELGMCHGLTADGSLRKLFPEDVKVEHSRPRLKGVWWADPNLFK